MPTTLAPARLRGTTHPNLFVAGTRHELRLQIAAVIRDVAPRWDDGHHATIVLDSPALGPADAEAAFAEIHEKWHVEGVELRIHDEEDEHVLVVLAPRPNAAATSG